MNIPRAALGALIVLAAVAGPAVAQLPTLELSAGIHLIRAEVANTFDARARGLMFRKSLGAGSGMLFVFPEVSRHCMWMKNTYVPLSVAFMDEQGTIVSIHDMKPQDETSHCAAKPARFALEMNQGWFAQKGIKAGARIGGLDRAPPPR
ncbi:MAG: DUF192 domain-containing protein [Burkholderiales bacterium]